MTSEATDAPERATWRGWVGLAVLTLPVFMMATDMTALFLALPAIAADLRPTGAQSLWLLHVGEFLAAGLVLTMGRVADIVGRRRLLVIGVSVYGVASLLAAYSTSAEMLIAMRALLGMAAASLMPSAVGLIRVMFRDPRQFSVAFATLMVAFSTGAALGPPLAGFLLELFWWGSVFLANVVAAAALLAAAPFLLPANRDRAAGRVDLPSVALSVVAIMALVFGFQEGADQGFRFVHVAAIAVGAATAALFVRRQSRLADPLLHLDLFRAPGVPVAIAVLLLMQLAFGAADLYLIQHLQVAVGLSATYVGLLTAIPAAVSVVAIMLIPVLLRLMRPAFAIATGLGTALAGAVTIVATLPEAHLVGIVTGNSLVAIGVSLGITLGAQLVVSSSPEERVGSASAVNDVSAGLGFAASLAFVGSLAIGLYRWVLRAEAPAEVTGDDLATALDSAGGATAVADTLPADVGARLLAAVGDAMLTATQGAYLTGAVLITLAAVLVLWRLRRADVSEAGAGSPDDPGSGSERGPDSTPDLGEEGHERRRKQERSADATPVPAASVPEPVRPRHPRPATPPTSLAP